MIPCDSRLYNDAREGSFVSLAKMCKRYSPPFSQEPRFELNLLMLILLIVEKTLRRPKLRVYLLTSVAINSSVAAVNNSVLNWDYGVGTGIFY